MKLNNPDQGVLGAGSAQRFAPQRYDFYERQWKKQRGAWGDPEAVAKRLHEDVLAVIDAFRDRGSDAGLREARQRGVLAGAQTYLRIRAWTEEELAAILARIRARLVRTPTSAGRVEEAFVLARLLEVRESNAKGHTPDQAVVDLPEVPRKVIPRWLTITGLVLSGIGVTIGVINLINKGKRT